MSAGGADRLLALVVRLLPPGRAEWGRAMRAEATAIEPGLPRWGYVLGCVRVVLVQSPVGLLALAARRAGARGPALGTGAAASLAAAAWWLAAQLLFPPVPAGIGGAVVVAGLAIGAVVYRGARRDDRAQDTLLAALGVATCGTASCSTCPMWADAHRSSRLRHHQHRDRRSTAHD
ncbi:hypothetical protein [Dactylosporangium salmoneum]|uniref:hypothetical protein n=1 Tax=Dactylosporangium salmoneum TaxID=53361 RepID=UPI0031D9175D